MTITPLLWRRTIWSRVSVGTAPTLLPGSQLQPQPHDAHGGVCLSCRDVWPYTDISTINHLAVMVTMEGVVHRENSAL